MRRRLFYYLDGALTLIGLYTNLPDSVHDGPKSQQINSLLTSQPRSWVNL